MNRSLLLSAGIGLTIEMPAWTQTFPAKPIRVVFAYVAGGPNDEKRLCGEQAN